MAYPEGFGDLVSMAAKLKQKPASGKEIWDRFCDTALMGKDRYEPEIRLLRAMLSGFLEYDFVKKSTEFGWHDKVEEFLKQRMEKIRDEQSREAISGAIRDLPYIASSLKAGSNFFESKKMLADIASLTKTPEQTEALIKEITELPGFGFSKAIMWLHSIGRAADFAPPTRYMKTFLNSDVGPYYQYYDDDDYFMKKFAEIAKDFPKTSPASVYKAVYFYRAFKSSMPRGSKFTPKKLIAFLKRKKMGLEKLQEALSGHDTREAILQEMCDSL